MAPSKAEKVNQSAVIPMVENDSTDFHFLPMKMRILPEIWEGREIQIVNLAWHVFFINLPSQVRMRLPHPMPLRSLASKLPRDR